MILVPSTSSVSMEGGETMLIAEWDFDGIDGVALGMGADMAGHDGHVSRPFLLISARNSVRQLSLQKGRSTTTLGVLLGNSSSFLRITAMIGREKPSERTIQFFFVDGCDFP